MAFRKYQSVEDTDLVSKKEHGKLSKLLKKQGKSKVSDLDERDRENIVNSLDKPR